MLFQALKSAQLKVDELQDQAKRLLLKNSELRAEAKPGKRTRTILNGDEKLISQYAKKFGVMSEMFMPPGALAVKKPLTNSMDPGRYDSELAELEGKVAEVYGCLPEAFHNDIQNSVAFRNLVSKLFNSFAIHLQNLF